MGRSALSSTLNFPSKSLEEKEESQANEDGFKDTEAGRILEECALGLWADLAGLALKSW